MAFSSRTSVGTKKVNLGKGQMGRWMLAAAAAAASSIFMNHTACLATSQTWVVAPVDANWTTLGNWSGNAEPGSLNPTSNATRMVISPTFNSAIPASLIGSAANPLIWDNLRLHQGHHL